MPRGGVEGRQPRGERYEWEDTGEAAFESTAGSRPPAPRFCPPSPLPPLVLPPPFLTPPVSRIPLASPLPPFPPPAQLRAPAGPLIKCRAGGRGRLAVNPFPPGPGGLPGAEERKRQSR